MRRLRSASSHWAVLAPPLSIEQCQYVRPKSGACTQKRCCIVGCVGKTQAGSGTLAGNVKTTRSCVLPPRTRMIERTSVRKPGDKYRIQRSQQGGWAGVDALAGHARVNKEGPPPALLPAMESGKNPSSRRNRTIKKSQTTARDCVAAMRNLSPETEVEGNASCCKDSRQGERRPPLGLTDLPSALPPKHRACPGTSNAALPGSRACPCCVLCTPRLGGVRPSGRASLCLREIIQVRDEGSQSRAPHGVRPCLIRRQRQWKSPTHGGVCFWLRAERRPCHGVHQQCSPKTWPDPRSRAAPLDCLDYRTFAPLQEPAGLSIGCHSS